MGQPSSPDWYPAGQRPEVLPQLPLDFRLREATSLGKLWETTSFWRYHLWIICLGLTGKAQAGSPVWRAHLEPQKARESCQCDLGRFWVHEARRTCFHCACFGEYFEKNDLLFAHEYRSVTRYLNTMMIEQTRCDLRCRRYRNWPMRALSNLDAKSTCFCAQSLQ